MRARWVVATSLAMLVGSAIGVDAQGVVSMPAPVTAAEPTEGSAGSPVEVGSAWQLGRLPQPGRGPGTVRAVTAGPRGFVAVGETCPKRLGCRAAAWTSRDGLSWKVVDVDRRERQAGRAVDSSLADVSWGPGGYVAVGWYGPPWTPDPADGGHGGPEPRAAAWRSRDGERWQRVDGGFPFSSNPTPSQIVASDDGYMVLSRGRSMVATSPDGKRWRKHRAGISSQGGRIVRLAPLADGYAAIGEIWSVSPDGEPACCDSALWRSRDPKLWTPRVIAGEDSYLGRLTAIGDRVVVVEGPREADETAVPHGGLTWIADAEGSVDLGSVPGAVGLYAVGVAGDRFLVAGQASGQTCGPALWASDDGLGWSRVPWSGELPGGAQRWYDVDIASNDRRVVLVGTAEAVDPDKPRRRPDRASFVLSAPLEAIGVEAVSQEASDARDDSGAMPVARLTTADGSTVEGYPVRGCWVAGDTGEPVTECFESVPDPGDLPVVSAAGERVPLRLTLSDGSALAAVSVAEHDWRGDITTTDRLVSTDPCTTHESVDFEVDPGKRILYAYITFGGGQGSAEYRFRLERPADEVPR